MHSTRFALRFIQKCFLNILFIYLIFSQDLFKIFGIRDFLPSDFIIRWLAKYVCSDKDLETFCSDIIFIICGFDKKQLNEVSQPSVTNEEVMFVHYLTL